MTPHSPRSGQESFAIVRILRIRTRCDCAPWWRPRHFWLYVCFLSWRLSTFNKVTVAVTDWLRSLRSLRCIAWCWKLVFYNSVRSSPSGQAQLLHAKSDSSSQLSAQQPDRLSRCWTDTWDRFWARLKVIDSLNAAKNCKYSLILTPTPCIVESFVFYLFIYCTDASRDFTSHPVNLNWSGQLSIGMFSVNRLTG